MIADEVDSHEIQYRKDDKCQLGSRKFNKPQEKEIRPSLFDCQNQKYVEDQMNARDSQEKKSSRTLQGSHLRKSKLIFFICYGTIF